MTRAPKLEAVSTKLQRIAQLAREDSTRSLTSLAHHIDVEFLQEAYRRTRKDGAPGVDGETSKQYEENLEENLRSLLDRFKSGDYQAPPVRRVYIPKGSDPSKKRPIGIPTLEDKVLQRAVTMVVEAVYEQDFLDCSYGFRPRRSAHQAIRDLRQAIMEMGGGWVCEADIEGFYEALNRGHLRSFLGHRVRDGVIRRTIDKWLKAGVMEKGSVFHPETGTPQGGVISPLLSNIYLHEVLDKWFVTEVLPLLKGRGVLIRYADDFVLVFECESDARRVMAVLAKRFAKYGLRLHPEKTRRFCFKRPWGPPEAGRKDRGARSFEFLGFTHYWGKSRRGYWVIKRKSASSRVSRFLRGVSQWCRRHRHKPVGWQHGRLVSKLRGHYGYFAVRGNIRALNGVRDQAERAWRKWLNRRSHKSRMSWKRFGPLLERYPLPKPRILHAI